jgi:hypothetical protein
MYVLIHECIIDANLQGALTLDPYQGFAGGPSPNCMHLDHHYSSYASGAGTEKT